MVLVVFLGYCYLVWLGFKGGKGVVIFIGIMLVFVWLIGLIVCVMWFLVVVVIWYLFLLVLLVVGMLLVFVVFLNYGDYGLIVMLLVVLIYWCYCENISCFCVGIESKIG